MTHRFCHRARRHAISWGVRVRRVDEAEWNVAKAVNLSVTGILLRMPPRYRVGDCLEWEIDCLFKQDMTTILRGIGEVVREDNNRGELIAIRFDARGASIVRAERREVEACS